MDEFGQRLSDPVGPFNEAAHLNLICEAEGGKFFEIRFFIFFFDEREFDFPLLLIVLLDFILMLLPPCPLPLPFSFASVASTLDWQITAMNLKATRFSKLLPSCLLAWLAG